MEKSAAQKLVEKTLQSPFDKERFVNLVKNILNHVEDATFTYQGNLIFDAFADSIRQMERIGKYEDPKGKKIDILVVHLRKETTLERARTKQRNYIAKYLKSRGGVLKDAALVAFVAPNGADWRFSFVKMEYRFNEKGKLDEEFTPARRYSFLVGENESSHTAQSCLIPALLNDDNNPTLESLEDIFSIEKTTDEFFEKYRELFLRIKESLDEIVKKDAKVGTDFQEKNIETDDFAKKLLGQITFLYFLQKKGWFGVERGAEWGSGSKHFLRELFNKGHGDYKNFFNDVLEPLFYNTLATERSKDWSDRFNCRIPFLNGGLFDPLNNYDWVDTDILLHNDIFSNNHETKEGDIGNGVLDIFDRYNFTVKEDEPLEKEVAVDPEMLGKVFENLLTVKDRKSQGTYYTPREIVHYMCQGSLINYLSTELSGKVSQEDIETLIKYGEASIEHDTVHMEKTAKDSGYRGRYDTAKIPESIRQHARLIDEKLELIHVCDPAVGSGAFVVGMMNEIVTTRNTLTPHIGKSDDRTPYHFKRQAIQNCFYGVDIDPAAVEIAKLRLWLSLVVDEEERATVQPLPNLDYKIIQGNSLLSVERDLLNSKLFDELEEIKLLLFNETSKRKRQEHQNQIDVLISQITNNREGFGFGVYFSEVFRKKQGFDVVIANPPYVSALEATKTIDAEERKSYKKRFFSAKGAYDLYIIFFELGINLLKANGVLTFISPSKYLSASYGAGLREFILKYSLLELADFSQTRAFKSAAVSTLVTTIKKSRERAPVRTIKTTDLNIIRGERVIENKRQNLTLFPENIWGFLLSDHMDILEKVWGASSLMEEIASINASSTASEASEYASYIHEKKTTEESLKVINTGTIDHIFNHWGRVPFKNRKLSIETPYMELAKVKDRRKKMYMEEKLIFSKVAREITSTYDKYGEFASTNTNFVYEATDLSLSFLAAYTNSTLADFIYKQLFGGLIMLSGWQFQAPQLRIFPIPKHVENENPISNIVTKILEIGNSRDYLQNSAKQDQVRSYEKQIDQLIYQLYDLTDKEIRIIEQHSNKKNRMD